MGGKYEELEVPSKVQTDNEQHVVINDKDFILILACLLSGNYKLIQKPPAQH